MASCLSWPETRDLEVNHAGRGSSQEATRKANSAPRIDSETARLAAQRDANRRRKRGAGAPRIGHAPRKSNGDVKNRKRIGQESSSRNRGPANQVCDPAGGVERITLPLVHLMNAAAASQGQLPVRVGVVHQTLSSHSYDSPVTR